MRGTDIAALAILAAAILPYGTVSAQEAGRFYISGSGGLSMLSTAENKGRALTVESDFDNGPFVAGAIGYAWPVALRLEGEVSYASHSLDQLTVTNAGGTGVRIGTNEVDGDVTRWGFMANAAFDLKTNPQWQPFLMAGIGFAHISANDVKVLGVRLTDDSTTVLAYQFGAGINYVINNNWTVGLQYRYVATQDPTLTDAAGSDFDSEYASHNVLLHLRYNL